MRRTTIWRTWLLTALTVLAPGVAAAQNVGLEDPEIPLPLGHSRMEDGGFFMAGRYVMYRQTVPLKDQTVAVRGVIDVDGSILSRPLQGIFSPPGTFVGPGTEALNVTDASGPQSYQPGFGLDLGWRFRDGSALTFSWTYITKTLFNAAATLAPPGLNAGTPPLFANTFLTSPVFNFPLEFAGPPNKVAFAGPNAAFGIWNGASVMTIEFEQRAQQYELTYRVPIFETDCFRCSGLVGPRFFWIWERFKWRTVDIDIFGNIPDPTDVGIYWNIVSNRMYGAHAGFSNEWYIGKGFALNLDVQAAAFIDVVREKAQYQLGTKHEGPESKRSRTDYTVVPELQLTPSVMWYPVRGVQFNVGWDAFIFFNTVASQRPIDFNYGAVAPHFDRVIRFFDGFTASIALTF
jgi:hypothetical protein